MKHKSNLRSKYANNIWSKVLWRTSFTLLLLLYDVLYSRVKFLTTAFVDSLCEETRNDFHIVMPLTSTLTLPIEPIKLLIKLIQAINHEKLRLEITTGAFLLASLLLGGLDFEQTPFE